MMNRPINLSILFMKRGEFSTGGEKSRPPPHPPPEARDDVSIKKYKTLRDKNWQTWLIFTTKTCL